MGIRSPWRDLETVRFIGVDTPEKNHPKLPIQFMATESTRLHEKSSAWEKNIRLEYDPHDEDKRGELWTGAGISLPEGWHIRPRSSF